MMVEIKHIIWLRYTEIAKTASVLVKYIYN